MSIEKGLIIFFAIVTLIASFVTIMVHVVPPPQPYNLGLVFWAGIALFWAAVYGFHVLNE